MVLHELAQVRESAKVTSHVRLADSAADIQSEQIVGPGCMREHHGGRAQQELRQCASQSAVSKAIAHAHFSRTFSCVRSIIRSRFSRPACPRVTKWKMS